MRAAVPTPCSVGTSTPTISLARGSENERRATATVENGRFVALKPDPSHPTGKALCIKGKVAPELVYHADRLLYPMKRTRPKGDGDPGWQRIGWDEALDTVAKKLTELSDRHGPESVAFSSAPLGVIPAPPSRAPLA